MSGKISVLDIDIDNYTAKEAMRQTVAYLESEPVSIIEMVTVDGLMEMNELVELKSDMQKFDLILAGDKAILEAADITDHRALQEVETNLFLKMIFRYLHKNHKRLYLLVETEEEGREFYAYLERCYGGVQIIGMAKVSANDLADDMLVNAMNGGEIDCVVSMLPVPQQESFITRNRDLLNAHVFLGLGKGMLPVGRQGVGQKRITQFLMNRIFKKEIEKRKRTLNHEVVSVK